MESDKINALATSVIAFVTIVGLMIGFYYNLKSANAKVLNIWALEIVLLVTIKFFTRRIKEVIKNES
ncbi:MAG: hypothetical protein Q7R96_06705 [Nanoarchaeota archaeon]|nr:hypothetical protein [Nanoarchaeota archaeon]